MLSVEDWMDLKQLNQQGHSIRAIAQMSGHSRNTVRRVLRETAPKPYQKPQRASCLDPYKPYLLEREKAARLSAVRLLEEIRPQGYLGSIDVLRRYLKSVRADQKRQSKMTVRFETPPGQQAQADWAYVGKFPDAHGALQSVYAFVMVLSFSRMLYVEFTTSMSLPTLLHCHQNAFASFGGIPQSVLYDNMKQVKLEPGVWTPLFLDFISHYGIVPKTHRVRRPRTKGKVERMVAYVQDNFLNGRTFAGLEDLNAQGQGWLDRTANVRVHATTGERPCDLLLREKECLTPLTAVLPYQICSRYERKVDAEGFVRLDRSRYSVPPEQVGKTVLIIQQAHKITIRSGNLIVAEHSQAPAPGACMTQKDHLEALWQQSVQTQTAPPPAVLFHADLLSPEAVVVRPLSVYETVAGNGLLGEETGG